MPCPGRYAKVSERVREGNTQRMDLSFVALIDGAVVGGVRLWPVMVDGVEGLFLGPIAVEANLRHLKIGGRLVRAAMAKADAEGAPFTLLVGDMPFFGPLGFEITPAGQVELPVSTDPRRVLWRVPKPEGLNGAAGKVHIPLHARRPANV